MRFTIGKKIILGDLVIIVMLAVTGVIVYLGYHVGATALREIDQQQQTAVSLNTLQHWTLELTRAEKRYIISREIGAYQAWEKAFDALSSAVERVDAALSDQNQRDALGDFALAQVELKKAFADVHSFLSKAGADGSRPSAMFLTQGAQKISIRKSELLTEIMSEAVADLLALNEKLISQKTLETTNNFKRIGVAALITILAGLAISGVVALLTSRSISRPIRILRNSVEHFSQGRLDSRIDARFLGLQDEVGDLARSFNDMAENLQTTTVSRDELQAQVEQRKQAESNLKKYTIELEHSNRELQDFAYVASHDLQEPLRKVQVFGDLLNTKCSEVLSEQGKDYVQRMQSSTKRMQILISDLLLFSQVTSKGQKIEPVDLSQVAKHVVEDLGARIDNTNATVDVEGLTTIDADSTQMRQLLQNLIANALKFHRPDVPPIVKVRGSIVHARNGNDPQDGDGQAMFRITVEDNGIGFEEKYGDRIFTIFQRLHGRREYEGTGVGLAVCRKIAERHGGSITANGVPGQGATFVVTMPITSRTQEEPG